MTRYQDPTDLVATGRQDVEVTRWFRSDGIGEEWTTWTPGGDTLTLEASRTGFANGDARFRGEVPLHTAVPHDGRATGLKGTATC
ncbi:hypothetical protein [Kitasatospora sp. NPDC008115]|uniref:hypothetical protein n=1 Tax=Kitasatospora sp. NPDC008115 TaxID=3364022 RepID=UPI0036E92E89